MSALPRPVISPVSKHDQADTFHIRLNVVMELGDVATWVSVVFSLLSMGGAAFAWWRANQSCAAKEQAETARQQAEETLAAVKDQARAATEQATQVGRIAESLQPPPLVARKGDGKSWVIRNTTSEPLTITRWRKPSGNAIVHWYDKEFPFTVPSQQSFQGLVKETARGSLDELVFDVEGLPDPITVPLNPS